MRCLLLSVLTLCPLSVLSKDRCESLFTEDTERATCATLLNLYGEDASDDDLREQVSRQVYGVSAADAEALRRRNEAKKLEAARHLDAEIEKTQCGRLFSDHFERDVCLWNVGLSSRTLKDEELRNTVLGQIARMRTDHAFRDGVMAALRNLRHSGIQHQVYALEAEEKRRAAEEEEKQRREIAEREREERRISFEKDLSERQAQAEKDRASDATGTNLYRCAGPGGKRLTRDRYDVRAGETCAPVSREEQARMKAEAARPPTPAEKAKMTSRADSLDFWRRCAELGRVLRNPDTTPKGQYWESAVIAAARISPVDQGYIVNRRLRIGMDECSVVAVLGKPDALNRTNHRGGRSDQLVYRDKRIYVYTDNGVVRSWQE